MTHLTLALALCVASASAMADSASDYAPQLSVRLLTIVRDTTGIATVDQVMAPIAAIQMICGVDSKAAEKAISDALSQVCPLQEIPTCGKRQGL